MAPHRPGHGPLATLLAALLAGAALGGCSGGEDGLVDGGISGTGADLGSAPAGTPTGQGLDAAVAPAAVDAADAPAPAAFDNALPARDGLAPLLRGVNLSARTVALSVDGVVRGTALAPGSVGDPIPVTGAARLDVVVSDADTGDVLERLDAGLGPRSSTTLVVRAGADVVPLETLARAPDASTALVRVVWAGDPSEASARVAALSLVPAGDAPGASRAGFAAPRGSIASAYEAVGPGDYALSADGGNTSATLSFDGGDVVTLAFSAPADPADGPGPFTIVPDGEVP